jgi:hypothetical protein
LADASHSHDQQQSNDCLAPSAKVTKEEEEEEGRERGEEERQMGRGRKGEQVK